MQRIADNLQITQPVIERALREMNPHPIRQLVTQVVAAGAQAIDINLGLLTRNAERHMTFCVETVQSVTDLPLLIDTANPLAMAAGLKASRNPTIINGFSLEPRKLEGILPLAARYQTEIIGYLLSPDGHVQRDAETRLNLALMVLEAARAAGVPEEHLIIDPVVVPVIWEDGQRQAMAVLDTLRLLPEVLGYPVRTIVGLSNLTAGASTHPGRRLLEYTYLPMLAATGLNMVLMNHLRTTSVAVAKACDSLTSGKIFSWVELDTAGLGTRKA